MGGGVDVGVVLDVLTEVYLNGDVRGNVIHSPNVLILLMCPSMKVDELVFTFEDEGTGTSAVLPFSPLSIHHIFQFSDLHDFPSWAH